MSCTWVHVPVAIFWSLVHPYYYIPTPATTTTPTTTTTTTTTAIGITKVVGTTNADPHI